MLVLSRKSMERIQIGESVVITVVAIQGNKVRIGIDAPKAVPVLRAELQAVGAAHPVTPSYTPEIQGFETNYDRKTIEDF